jgi:hypothetical protein
MKHTTAFLVPDILDRMRNTSFSGLCHEPHEVNLLSDMVRNASSYCEYIQPKEMFPNTPWPVVPSAAALAVSSEVGPLSTTIPRSSTAVLQIRLYPSDSPLPHGAPELVL